MEQGKRSLGRALMFAHEGNARLPHAQTARGIAEQFARLSNPSRTGRQPRSLLRHATANRVASAKLKLCGPISTGRPTAQASRRFCPPRGSRLPPTNAMSLAA